MLGLKSKVVVGSCGRCCSDCQFFEKKCFGCKVENKRLGEECLIYKCAKKKKVRNCLNCPTTIPKCKLMSGLSKNYCLVVAIKKEFGGGKVSEFL